MFLCFKIVFDTPVAEKNQASTFWANFKLKQFVISAIRKCIGVIIIQYQKRKAIEPIMKESPQDSHS